MLASLFDSKFLIGIAAAHAATPSLFRRRDAGEFRRLALEQPAIDSSRPGGERGMGTLLDDLAAVEHQDAVEAAHRRQPVRDHDRGASLDEPLHRLLDQGLRFGIEARRRLVEDQDRRVGKKRARQRDALPLAARQLDAAFADQRAVALRQSQDELMRVGKTRGLLDRRHAGARPAVGDVLGQRAVKQDRILLHDRDLAAQRMLRRLSDILTVDQDSSAADVVKPLHQLDEGGLAGAGAADQPDAFAGADVHRQPVIQRDAMAAVEECHVLEHDASAVDADRQRVSGVGNADRLIMDRNKFLHVVHRTLQVVDVHADITQIGVDDVIAGQHIGDVARRGMACDPQQQRAADHGGADEQQHRELRRRGVIISQPGPAHAGAPPADDARQPPVISRWRTRVRRTWLRYNYTSTAQLTVLLFVRASVVGGALLLWIAGHASPGDVTYVLTSYYIIHAYLRDVGMHINNLQRSVNDMEELVAIHDEAIGIADAADAPANVLAWSAAPAPARPTSSSWCSGSTTSAADES